MVNGRQMALQGAANDRQMGLMNGMLGHQGAGALLPSRCQERFDRFAVVVSISQHVPEIRVASDTELAGYPANLFCRISGIRPDIRLNR